LHIFKSLIALACAVFMIALPVTTKAEDEATQGANAGQDGHEALPDPSEDANELQAESKFYIPWLFNTLEEPDFTAPIMGQYEAQEVTLIQSNADGWAQIETDRGNGWTYLPGDKTYINKVAYLFNSINGATPVASISPQVVKIVQRENNWALIETWIGNKWLDLTLGGASIASGEQAPDTPKQAAAPEASKDAAAPEALDREVLLNVPAYSQRALGYYTGCEIVSLGMMINYKTQVSVKTLVSKMPRSNDPAKGFRGEPTSSGGFTILPSALTALTTEDLGQAKNMTGCSMDDLKRQLQSGCPIVVWVNGLGFNVHAVCLTGYNGNGFYYNDPWRGSKDALITYKKFYSIWNKPIYDGQRNVTFPIRLALSYIG
jgi:uncharacterized protein YvpB